MAYVADIRLRMGIPMSFRSRSMLASVTLFTLLAMSIVAAERHKRAALKKFDRAQTDKVFFPNLFSVLVGKRPENPGKQPQIAAAPGTGSSSTTESGGKSFPWSKLIDADQIEDEIKSLNLRVQKVVTTPGKFRSGGHKEARILFTELAMLFAVISEYDGKIRWQKDAHGLREMFARVARNTKAGGNTSTYQEARTRKTDLQDLVRGGSVKVRKAEPNIEDWNKVAQRSPLMVLAKRLFNEQLKPMTSSKKEFMANGDKIKRNAQLLAVISEVLLKKEMPDFDSEEYAEFAKTMKKALLDLSMAVQQKDDVSAGKVMGIASTACDACHELYRSQ